VKRHVKRYVTLRTENIKPDRQLLSQDFNGQSTVRCRIVFVMISSQLFVPMLAFSPGLLHTVALLSQSHTFHIRFRLAPWLSHSTSNLVLCPTLSFCIDQNQFESTISLPVAPRSIFQVLCRFHVPICTMFCIFCRSLFCIAESRSSFETLLRYSLRRSTPMYSRDDVEDLASAIDHTSDSPATRTGPHLP
jgi:hypothetical protein